MHDEQAAAAADVAEMRERLEIVVADLRQVRRHGERPAVEVVERVAVGRRLGDDLHCYAAGVARTVLEHQWLAEQGLERPRQRPRARFRGAARRVADPQPDRLSWIA